MAGPPRDDGESRDEESHYRRAALQHPLRLRIARCLAGGGEASGDELAVELGAAPARVAYHLRLLRRQRVLQVVPRRNPTPPRYRWGPDAEWALEMLAGKDEKDA
jgi:DNA-binding transcriptional ArsR family regulator